MPFNPEKMSPLERTDALIGPDEKPGESLVRDLAEKEGEYREDLAKEGLPAKSINRLADKFSDETLEKLEENKAHKKTNEQLSKMEERAAEAEKDSMHDHLTGLMNRRALDEFGVKIINENMRFGRPCSALLLDIDFFKKINDTYGHLTGDKVLKGVANIIERTVRKTDIVCRWGGEEFAVIMPETDPPAAEILAERIRKRIEAVTIEEIKLTISIGVSGIEKKTVGKQDKEKRKVAIHMEEDGKNNLDILFNKADKALYISKESGRNKVTAFKEEISEDNDVSPESKVSEAEADEFFKKNFD